MTYLSVLSNSPKDVAEATADIHLNNSIVMCAKLLSTAIQVQAPEKLLKNKMAGGVVREYLFDDALTLLPPIKAPQFTPWIDWIRKEYQHAWWLVTLAWFLDKELTERFDGNAPKHPMDVKIQAWVKWGVTKLFPKSPKKDLLEWEFPVVLPSYTGFLQYTDPVKIYREYYSQLLKKGLRMKWTKRGIPTWLTMPSTSLVCAKVCSECGAVGADARICTVESCPGKKMYNL